MNLEITEQLIKVVPQHYVEAIQLYPWIKCESHEWDNRTTIENAIWLIRHLTTRSSRADKAGVCPGCGSAGSIHDKFCTWAG